ncbi:regulatory YrvL family protein [Ralstonia pickettii]|nr:regulatory YrvL family protein [Ralstonia pickettii]
MSSHNEEKNQSSDDEEVEVSFKDMNIKEKLVTIIGIALLIILVIGIIFGLYFFGLAGVFKVLGVQYDSVWSLVIFVISVFILSFFFELFSKVIYILLARQVTGKVQLVVMRLFIETASNWLVLFTVDEFMNSITLSFKAELIVALLLAVIEIVFDDKEEK